MTDANEALRALETLCWNLPNGEQQQAHDLINSLRAHLTGPGYVRVPVELIETLKDMSDRHIRTGTVLTVDMNDIALHLDMLAAATKETSHD